MTEVITLKHIAESFLNLAAAGSVDQAYTKYVDSSFIHHNQHYKGDRESLKQAMEESIIKFSGMKLDVKTVVEDGDRVITYSHIRANSSDMEIAAFHMFKFNDGKIIEMWDVGQVISKNSPNEHGMF